MDIKDYEVPKQVIKHKGVFALSELLQAIRGKFNEFGYDFHEPKHIYGSAPEGAREEIDIYGEKKHSEYVKFRVDVKLKIFEMKAVEVVKGGQKLLMNSARMLLEITGKMQFDPTGRFKKGKLLTGLQDFYHRFIIKKSVENVWSRQLFTEVTGLARAVKDSLSHEVA